MRYRPFIVLSACAFLFMNGRKPGMLPPPVNGTGMICKQVPEGGITGDFNGDGKTDTVWLQTPVIKEGEMACNGDCSVQVQTSIPAVGSFTIAHCIGGDLHNLGDLDGNGTDEFGMLHNWFTSCWQPYYVFTLKNKQWQYLVEPITTHCNQWDDLPPVKKDPKRKGYLLVHYSVSNDKGIFTKTKYVKIHS